MNTCRNCTFWKDQNRKGKNTLISKFKGLRVGHCLEIRKSLVETPKTDIFHTEEKKSGKGYITTVIFIQQEGSVYTLENFHCNLHSEYLRL